MQKLIFHKLGGYFFLEHEDIEKQCLAAGSGSFDTNLMVIIIFIE